MSHTIVNHAPLRTIADLLKALDELEQQHICKYEIVRGTCSNEGSTWKCECGKSVKSN